jgi:hypothetical protein
MATYKGFRGLNTVDPETRLAFDELREALNIDLDKTGLARRRKGYTVINEGTAHSLWSHGDLTFFVRGTELRRLQPDDTDTLLAEGLTLDKPVSYAEVNGEVYWGNGQQQGVIRGGVNHPWGILPPASPSLTVLASGSLPPGKYQACATLIDVDGREGPAGMTSSITLANNTGGIELTLLSGLSAPRIKEARLYLTPANGDQFYLVGTITASAPSLFVVGGHYTIPLRTQDLRTPPPGQIVRYYRGRLWIAQNHVLWFTDALGYHLHDPRRNFYLLPEPINLLEPVTDGLFIGSDRTYFLAGTQPEEMNLREVASYPAIAGTSVLADGSHVRIGEETLHGPSALWASPKGICAGASGGVFLNLTEKRIAMETAHIGAGLFREQGGLRQYLALLQQPEGDSLKTTDRFSATIIRGGGAP